MIPANNPGYYTILALLVKRGEGKNMSCVVRTNGTVRDIDNGIIDRVKNKILVGSEGIDYKLVVGNIEYTHLNGVTAKIKAALINIRIMRMTCRVVRHIPCFPI